jgi:hypothetical protein
MSFTWTKLSDSESGPEINFRRITYYDGSLYTHVKDHMYIYNLNTSSWTSIIPKGESDFDIYFHNQCIYEGSLYLIKGIDIYKIDLSNHRYEVQEISIPKEGMAELSSGYDCVENQVYIFGGDSVSNGFFNTLSIIDLSSQNLEFQILTNNMNVPTARRGHAMEAYNDKLYIFGGVDGNKKR